MHSVYIIYMYIRIHIIHVRDNYIYIVHTHIISTLKEEIDVSVQQSLIGGIVATELLQKDMS